MTQKNALRVWWIHNVPNKPEHHPVESVKQAVTKINALTQRDLGNPFILSNACGLEIFEDGEWCEYYNDEGQNITEIMED